MDGTLLTTLFYADPGRDTRYALHLGHAVHHSAYLFFKLNDGILTNGVAKLRPCETVKDPIKANTPRCHAERVVSPHIGQNTPEGGQRRHEGPF